MTPPAIGETRLKRFSATHLRCHGSSISLFHQTGIKKDRSSKISSHKFKIILLLFTCIILNISHPSKMGCGASTQKQQQQTITTHAGTSFDSQANNGTYTETRTIPDRFYCPISRQVMQRPVVASDGITYDERNIYEWVVTRGQKTSPTTRQPLEKNEWYPNILLQNEISDYIASMNHKLHHDENPKEGSLTRIRQGDKSSNSTKNDTHAVTKTAKGALSTSVTSDNLKSKQRHENLKATNDAHNDDFEYVGEGTLVTSSSSPNIKFYGVVQYRKFTSTEQSLLRVMKMICSEESECVGFHYNNDPSNTSQHLQCALLYDVDKLMKSGRFDTIHEYVPPIMRELLPKTIDGCTTTRENVVVWSCLDKPAKHDDNDDLVWNGTGIPNSKMASKEVDMGWDTWYCYRKINF